MAQHVKPNLKVLSECSLGNAVSAWNQGFAGYVVDMTLTVDGYLARLYTEQISPELSFIAFVGDKPAGFLLNGIRIESNGRKVAWNGGTGVASEFRGQGVGTFLMEAAIELYEKTGIDVATLEAVSNNISAISLYQKFGYANVERLVFLEHQGSLGNDSFLSVNDSYSVRSVSPLAVSQLPFYPDVVPWQAHWQNLFRNGGEALIVADGKEGDVGYALYKRDFTEHGRLKRITLSQCGCDPTCSDVEAVVRTALKQVFSPLDVECERMTHNFSTKNSVVTRMLERAGFSNFIEQVHMVKTFPR